MTRRERLTIGGMSCPTCSETVSESLEALDGVEEASVNFATDEGTVEYDPDTVSLAEIYEAIDEAGYEPRARGGGDVGLQRLRDVQQPRLCPIHT